MDGVLIRGGQPIAGSVDYVAGLIATGKPFQIFTNNSRFTPEDHAERLKTVGLPCSARAHLHVGARHCAIRGAAKARINRVCHRRKWPGRGPAARRL
ncbi:hypothetical protein [Mesorhizobium sp. M1322]|uniref:hypothetical protein n=1 Tax=Mesorhizobium sp. M1322 TaxID=2957081 RepID=UPI003334B6C1